MPNLTSYHAPPIHLNRERPKTYCDLIRHEIDYTHFLRTRISNIQSSLSPTNQKQLTNKNKNPRREYFDHNQRLNNVYQRNFQLCKKILEIWSNNGQQKGGVDCHNENPKNPINISHFRLRQIRWKDKLETENKRFIRSLTYRRTKYRPVHNRYTAHQAYEYHLKLLKKMSQYPKYNLTNPIHKNLLNHHYSSEHIYYNYSQFYTQDPKISLQAQCQTLPFSYKQSLKTIKTKLNLPVEHKKTNESPRTYMMNVLQKTIDDAVYIYNQPLPSPLSRVQLTYSEDRQRLKPRFCRQQELLRSTSCRQLLEP